MTQLLLVLGSFFTLSAQAQFGNGPTGSSSGMSHVTQCVGGLDELSTTLTMTTMGMAGSRIRIEQGLPGSSVQSKSYSVFMSDQVAAAETHVYLDWDTRGKVLSFSYDFINQTARAQFVDPENKIKEIPALTCKRLN